MEYKKIIVDSYILGLAEVDNNGNISKAEYDRITEIIHNKPIAPEGYDYRLKDDLTWKLYELPIDEDLTAEEALEIISGGVADETQ